MAGSAAVMQPPWEDSRSVRTVLEADREHLTHLLRGLAARLDELDRRLSELAWRQGRLPAGPGLGETVCERTALETERARLNDRLGVLAQQLNTLDSRLSDTAATAAASAPVGPCPNCGYPSLGSGLCAFCRPHLAR